MLHLPQVTQYFIVYWPASLAKLVGESLNVIKMKHLSHVATGMLDLNSGARRLWQLHYHFTALSCDNLLTEVDDSL